MAVIVRVYALVFLFIIRLRFPSGVAVSDVIRTRYGDDVFKKIRALEKVDFKQRKAELDLEFLRNCQNHGFIPKFLRFRVANRHLRNSSAYAQCSQLLLSEEIKSKKSTIRSCKLENDRIQIELRTILTHFDYVHIYSLFIRGNDVKVRMAADRHERKFSALLDDPSSSHDPDKVIFNYSSYILSDEEKKVLSLGLNFSLPPKKLNFPSHLVPFELLFRSVKDAPFKNNNMDKFKTDLKHLSYTSYDKYNFRNELNITQREYSLLENLSNNKNIVIQKTDKGNAVVLINRTDYDNSMLAILSDTSKFVEVKVPPGKGVLNLILSHEGKLKEFLDSIRATTKQKHGLSGGIDETTYWKLFPQGTQPGRLYGNAKVHKPVVNGVPKFRPILSAIGTSSYKIAKFLVPILKPLETNEYVTKDSFTFAKEVRQMNPILTMASLDVESLFTNIPLDETIDICCAALFKHKRLVNGMNKREFRTLMEFATKDMMFLFNDRYYRQIEGVAMGSPLGPILANIFLCHHEKRWLRNCPAEFKPINYIRYVDDTFVLFWDESHVDKFQKYLNEQHPNIKFTVEKEQDNVLPFLDVLVKRTDIEFTTGTYRKPTFSGVYSNYRSFIPNEYKFGLVVTLLYRSFELVSDYLALDEEIKRLKTILKSNRFPEGFTDRVIYTFLQKKFTPKVVVHTVPKRKVRIVLPYLGRTSQIIKKKLLDLFRAIPSHRLEVIYQTTYRMGNLFRFKDCIPNSLMTDFVYFYKCGSCAASYVGRCYRHKHVRFCEHAGISARTGAPLKRTLVNASAVKVHALTVHPVDPINGFRILSRGGSREVLDIKESIMIKRLKPSLNDNVASAPLSLY